MIKADLEREAAWMQPEASQPAEATDEAPAAPSATNDGPSAATATDEAPSAAEAADVVPVTAPNATELPVAAPATEKPLTEAQGGPALDVASAATVAPGSDVAAAEVAMEEVQNATAGEAVVEEAPRLPGLMFRCSRYARVV